MKVFRRVCTWWEVVKRKKTPAWKGMKSMQNDLNEFYARFDCHDFESEINDRYFQFPI